MTDKRILRRIIVRQPKDTVLLELMQEGWPLIADNGDRAFLYKDRVVIARAVKAENN